MALNDINAPKAGSASRAAPSGLGKAERTNKGITYVDAGTFSLLIQRTEEASRCAERDIALAYIFFEAGLRHPEIAGLLVDDFLNPDGTVRQASEVRGEIAVNRKSRPLSWEHAEMRQAVQRYLAWRRARGHATSACPDEFGGLPPVPQSRSSWAVGRLA